MAVQIDTYMYYVAIFVAVTSFIAMLALKYGTECQCVTAAGMSPGVAQTGFLAYIAPLLLLILFVMSLVYVAMRYRSSETVRRLRL